MIEDSKEVKQSYGEGMINMDKDMHDAMDNKYMPMTSLMSGVRQEVAPDVYCFTNQIVNVYFVGDPRDNNEWVLIDTGMPESSQRIIDIATERFGEGCQPQAIILTHGHFDHVGAVVDLVERWQVPVYAHEMELPYLTGQSRYPEADGSVGGGLVARLSPLFPNEPVDLGSHVEKLPADGSVPHMPGWRWLHTPGHTPGHISLFREEDRVLIAGDAFVTVKQESLYKVIVQERELSGPPKYLTSDWDAAKTSVIKLESLKPTIAVTGHGQPMFGDELAENLSILAKEFDQIAVPDDGRYVNRTH